MGNWNCLKMEVMQGKNIHKFEVDWIKVNMKAGQPELDSDAEYYK